MLALLLIGLGLFLWLWMPINKKMWTVPFALLTSGIGGFVIFICYYLVDIVLSSLEEKSWIKKIGTAAIQYDPFHSRIMSFPSAHREDLYRPLIWMGMNPLAIFVLMIFLEILLLDTIHWDGDNLWYTIPSSYPSISRFRI